MTEWLLSLEEIIRLSILDPTTTRGHDGYNQTCCGQQGAKGAIRFDKHEILNIGSESISSNCPYRDRDSASNDSSAIEFAVQDDTRFPPANARTSEIASERELFGYY